MASEEVHIRQCSVDDVDTIIAITAEVFGPFALEHCIEKMLGRSESASWVDIKSQDIRNEIQTNPEGCFVAELDGRIVGYVTNTINELASRGIIANLAVLSEAQGLGAGRMLLLRSLEYFRGRRLRQAKIETLAHNQVGKHLYPSVGFQEVASQIHYVMSLE